MANGTFRLFILLTTIKLALSAADENSWSWSEYRKAVITPASAGRQLVTAGIAQWRDAPEEWGQGMEGYGKRYANRVATHAVRGTIRYNVAYFMHEDIKYKPSGLDSKWGRIKYAVKRTFVVPRTDGTGDVVSVARFAGAYGGAGISRLWHPADSRTVGGALSNGTMTLGFDVAGHIVKEFWPRKKNNGQIRDRKR
jgi:hypothetical protein